MTWFCGYCGAELIEGEDCNECPECLVPLKKDTKYQIPNGGLVKMISTDENFMNAMVKLYNEDPIEYQLKIAQFKNEINQKEQLEKQAQEKSTQRKCPKCGGTNFTPVRRKWSVLTGILTNKVDLVCNNCGYKWKP